MAGRQSPQVVKKMTAVPIPYPEGMRDKDKPKFKEEEMQKNPDKLYYDVRKNNQISNMIFYTPNYAGWRAAVKDEFPDLEETEMIWYKFKDTEGSVCVYPTGRIVVYGQLMDDFDDKFKKMKAEAVVKQMENLKLDEKKATEE